MGGGGKKNLAGILKNCTEFLFTPLYAAITVCATALVFVLKI